ncbi:MAG: PKD domain-containing protein [Thermoleophilia bacterium]
MHRRRSRALVAGLLVSGIGLSPAVAQGADWLGPSLANNQQCSTPDGGCGTNVAVDKGGKTLLAWTDPWDTNESYATVRLPDAPWQTTANLTAVAASDGFQLESVGYAGLNDTGHAIVFGRSGSSDMLELWRPSGQSWDSRRVADSASGAAHGQTGYLGTGNVKVAAWYRESGATWRIQARVGESATGGYGAIQTLDEGSGALSPWLWSAVDGEGNAYVAWTVAAPAGTQVRIARRPSGGAWATPVTVGTHESASIVGLRVNRRGDAAIGFWTTEPGGSAALRVYLRPAATGAWTAPGIPHQRAGLPGKVRAGGAIALGESGELAAAWTEAIIDEAQASAADARVLVADHQGGGIWTTAEVPGSRELPDNIQDAHDIAYDGRGGLVAAWMAGHTQLEGRYDVLGAARMAGGQWTPVRQLSSYGSPPQIVADGLGNTVVGSTGAEHSVWDAAGPRIISRSIPSSGQTGKPVTFSVNTQETWTGQNGPSEWYFGDGTSATGPSVGHAYAAPGVYTVTVLQRDGLGNVSSDSANVTISAAPGSGPLPPSPVLPPAISGSDIAGSTLTCQPGSWSAGASISAPTWIVAGTAVATGPVYVIKPSDVGKVVACQVTATNTVGSTRATSAFVVPRPGLSAPAAVTPETVAPPPAVPVAIAPTTARLGATARGKRVQLRARVNGALRVSPVAVVPRSGVVPLPAAWRGVVAAPAQWRIAPGPWRRAARTTAKGVEQARLTARKGTRVEVVETVGRRTRTRVLKAGPKGRVVLLKAAGGRIAWRVAPGPWRPATLL